MSIGEAIERVAARLAARRETSENYARKLEARLAGLYKTKIVETRETWAVRVHYPGDRTVWVTIRCVMYDDEPRWEWSRWLRPIADGDDLETVVTYLRQLFAGEIT